MSLAVVLLRDRPPYRRNAFVAGLRRNGYTVATGWPTPKKRRPYEPQPDHVLVVWNRYGANDQYAKIFERAGAAVLVAENGYLDFAGTDKTFAISLYQHNGAGLWPNDAPERFEKFDLDLTPWRTRGGDVLVLPQRGIGPPGVAMPNSWTAEVQRRLVAREGVRRPRVRPHPGTQRNVKPLLDDLEGVGAAVIWGSGAGHKALVAGVPVFYEFEKWIGGPAACAGIKHVRERMLDPERYMGDRVAMLTRLAQAQWTVEEVESGEPIERLVALHERRKERR